MFKIFKNGSVYLKNKFEDTDILVVNSRIAKFGRFDTHDVRGFGVELDLEVIDCENQYVIPGLVDSQIHLAGGSGESGFLSQPPRIMIEECVAGGITTTVGAIGVDTITKTMTNLVASVKAFREAGLSSYAYSGGYEIPPKTLTQDLRHDIYFVEEIIGAGEIAIADRRAPEPTPDELAKVVVDSYTGGIMTGKSGVTRLHVGEGKKRLGTAIEMMDRHEIIPESLYFTHMDRSEKLLDDAIKIAKHGCYVDLDIHDNNLYKWYGRYRDGGGRLDRMSFSTDAGACSPIELWREVRKCVLEHRLPLEEMVFQVTEVPATALKLKGKGEIEIDHCADLVVLSKSDLEIVHVLGNGKFFLKNRQMQYHDQPYTPRRKADWYGIRK